MKPQIIIQDYTHKGYHNTNPDSIKRLESDGVYKDLSTICVIPSRGMIHAKVVQNWLNMMPPMNQRFVRVFAIGLEVGKAYQQTFEMILDHPVLKTFKYVLTLEDDNMPPPDGLLKLYPSMNKYDVVSGLYWTKGEGGMPMIYGNPKKNDFAPQRVKTNTVQQARGLAMGFTLFKLDIFRDKRLEKPWFKTLQEYKPEEMSSKSYTQDLYFYEKAGKLGYKFACDNRIKVGHYSVDDDRIW
jgi:hypothetical protein